MSQDGEGIELPTLSVILPIHDKPADVIAATLAGLDGQDVDQVIIVRDRVPASLADKLTFLLARWNGTAKQVKLDGPAGWRSPCTAFNAGLAEVTSDLVLLNHSDIVQAPGMCRRAKELQAQEWAIYLGKLEESNVEACKGPGHAGPIICGSQNPRALCYFNCYPTDELRGIGGWDTDFERGCCYEDDDLMARLWQASKLPFIFDDSLHAVHQSHRRAYFLEQPVARNLALYLDKHGTARYFDREFMRETIRVSSETGRIRWDRV